MGIDAQIESEHGGSIAELPDPKGLVNWLLSFAMHEHTVCLRFVDPYGSTVFNSLQMPQLQAELEGLRTELTEANLQAGKRDYLRRAESWPPGAVEEVRKELESLTVKALQKHLDLLLTLINDAVVRGAHTYVRFEGD